MLPPVSNMPTTFQVFCPVVTVLPTVRPRKLTLAPRPTTTSLVPNSNIRPSTIRNSSRTLVACGSTPRIGTLAEVLVVIFGMSMTT